MKIESSMCSSHGLTAFFEMKSKLTNFLHNIYGRAAKFLHFNYNFILKRSTWRAALGKTTGCYLFRADIIFLAFKDLVYKSLTIFYSFFYRTKKTPTARSQVSTCPTPPRSRRGPHFDWAQIQPRPDSVGSAARSGRGCP